MNRTILLLGSNEGDRCALLRSARLELTRLTGTIHRSSPLYETAAWGKTDQPTFLNQALELSTPLDPEALLAATQNIEQLLGRQRIEKWGSRTLDIDILFYNDAVIRTPALNIPHPELSRRRFALVPVAAIAPDLQHPLLRQNIAELLRECPDPLPVTEFSCDQDYN